jgi:hypothetical protein
MNSYTSAGARLLQAHRLANPHTVVWSPGSGWKVTHSGPDHRPHLSPAYDPEMPQAVRRYR